MKRNDAAPIGQLIRHYLRLLVNNLNRHVGAQVITNIVFR